MKQNDLTINDLKEDGITVIPVPLSADMNKVPNVVLQRLIEEVQYESQNNILAYNRTHNRHNRGK